MNYTGVINGIIRFETELLRYFAIKIVFQTIFSSVKRLIRNSLKTTYKIKN